MRTYFKTLKNKTQRERSDKQRQTTKRQRRRQRMINVCIHIVSNCSILCLQKALARKKAVGISMTLSADTKTKLDPLMKADYMSSDESLSPGSDQSDCEDGEMTTQSSRKRLLKHRATWRSSEFEEFIQSIDRKIERRRTERGKMMVLERLSNEGSPCTTRSAPLDCPEWAKTVFD